MQEKFDKLTANVKRPPVYFNRPHWTRRHFFQVLGAGVTGSFLVKEAKAEGCYQANVETINKAKNVIFVLLTGAPSHRDTFDFKNDGQAPATAQPETINGILWPMGILPKLSNNLGDIAIVRSMRSQALVHSLAQTWMQIGRNPAAALGDIAPNIGSIVALEKTPERQPGHIFPSFLALNSNGAAGSGYLDSRFAPFRVNAAATGLANTTNNFDPASTGRFNEMWKILHSTDDPYRINSPLGKAAEDMNDFYEQAYGLMYNPQVNAAFRFTTADSQRYGNTAFGNACLTAKQVLAQNAGTRFIQITLGGWDMHQNIYTAAQNIFTLGRQFDNGLSELLNDLKATGLLGETLVVAVGEFGRTPNLSGAAGRDHYANHFAMFAGAGVTGGKIIGATTANGSQVLEAGWSRERAINAEDLEATIYSAMGINWTNICYNDPFGRGFEYVPNSKNDYWGPIHELWS
jgi:hypothetical protein